MPKRRLTPKYVCTKSHSAKKRKKSTTSSATSVTSSTTQNNSNSNNTRPVSANKGKQYYCGNCKRKGISVLKKNHVCPNKSANNYAYSHASNTSSTSTTSSSQSTSTNQTNASPQTNTTIRQSKSAETTNEKKRSKYKISQNAETMKETTITAAIIKEEHSNDFKSIESAISKCMDPVIQFLLPIINKNKDMKNAQREANYEARQKETEGRKQQNITRIVTTPNNNIDTSSTIQKRQMATAQPSRRKEKATIVRSARNKRTFLFLRISL